MKTLVYLKDVVTLQLDEDKCTACGMCVKVCPHEVFTITERKAKIVNRDQCMECGACAKNCAYDALTVQTGVGCAAGIIQGVLKGTEPTCSCGGSGGCC